MSSKRFKKLPEKTNKLESDLVDKLLPIVKNGFVYNLQYATDINGTSWNNVSNET